MNSGIYEIVNTVNGKRYVGSAVNLRHRWRQHRCELGKGRHNPHMQNAWNKYGEQAFEFRVLEFVEDKTLLIAREQHYIDSTKPEYNCAQIAGSNLGISRTAESNAKTSVASRKVWQRPGYREQMSLAHKGQRPTAAQLEKVSAALRGRKLSPEHAASVSKANTERNRSEAHRQLMSDYWKGRPKTSEQREKIAATKRGIPLTEAHKITLAAAMQRARDAGRCNFTRTDEVKTQIGRSLAKLTDAQVVDILAQAARGVKQSELAAAHGMANSAISNIVNRKTYRWVEFTPTNKEQIHG